MNRPTRRDEAVIEEAAQKLSTKLMQWAEAGESERAEYLSDAKNVLRSASVYDGYQLARELERRGYAADFALAEVCDNAYHLLSSAYSKAVENWVIENQIISPFQIGQQVTIDGGKVKGEVVGVNVPEATCTVCCPELGHVKEGLGTTGRIVPYEQIEAIRDSKW